MESPLGSYSRDFIFFVTIDWAQKARVFVPRILCQFSLMFAGKARRGAIERCFTQVGSGVTRKFFDNLRGLLKKNTLHYWAYS